MTSSASPSPPTAATSPAELPRPLTDSPPDALDVTLSADTLTRLDEIWPGPGGEAPEAYAW
ncbi:hypothetical protein [Streptomyces sp. SID2999]|uniref:hypothetical protein n=1 Tax=Streptomyces sp. SID2999 TaxID=2690258 RepID=UPI0019279AFA|nr:hypothetical protein [Streptomyces sp. SID2999]